MKGKKLHSSRKYYSAGTGGRGLGKVIIGGGGRSWKGKGDEMHLADMHMKPYSADSISRISLVQF